MPELGRDAFIGALGVLLKTGCIVKVRSSVYDPDHVSAQYQLAPIREDGELPEVVKETRQASPRTSYRAPEQSRVHEPAQRERPPTSLPEAVAMTMSCWCPRRMKSATTSRNGARHLVPSPPKKSTALSMAIDA
jgi:hypothetical protein